MSGDAVGDEALDAGEGGLQSAQLLHMRAGHRGEGGGRQHLGGLGRGAQPFQEHARLLAAMVGVAAQEGRHASLAQAGGCLGGGVGGQGRQRDVYGQGAPLARRAWALSGG
jgi:hypothetical protein